MSRVFMGDFYPAGFFWGKGFLVDFWAAEFFWGREIGSGFWWKMGV
jgi:hypothetical protein